MAEGQVRDVGQAERGMGHCVLEPDLYRLGAGAPHPAYGQPLPQPSYGPRRKKIHLRHHNFLRQAADGDYPGAGAASLDYHQRHVRAPGQP
ncbi:hypothetical protein D3C81_2085660 [compost metagenome]